MIGFENEGKRHLVVCAAGCASPTLAGCVRRRRQLRAFILGRAWIAIAYGEEGKIALCQRMRSCGGGAR